MNSYSQTYESYYGRTHFIMTTPRLRPHCYSLISRLNVIRFQEVQSQPKQTNVIHPSSAIQTCPYAYFPHYYSPTILNYQALSTFLTFSYSIYTHHNVVPMISTSHAIYSQINRLNYLTSLHSIKMLPSNNFSESQIFSLQILKLTNVANSNPKCVCRPRLQPQTEMVNNIISTQSTRT